MISLIIGSIIMFCALRIILKGYMTKKNGFDFRDKLILTLGGFVALDITAAVIGDIFPLALGLMFFAHWIILIYPQSAKNWSKLFKKLRW